MKYNSIVKKICNDMYKIDIYIAIGNYIECNQKLKRIFKIDNIMPKEWGGYSICVENDQEIQKFIIWIPEINRKNNNHLDTIAHESLHTVDRICKYINDDSNDVINEHRAYLMGWLVRKCLEVNDELLNKNKRNNKCK